MLPVLRTLQANWPDCHITWIIGKLEATLVDDIPGVEFIIFDKSQGLNSYFALHKQLKSRQFDILLHMQAASRASLISLLINAPIKLGFDRQRARDYQWLFTNRKIAAETQAHVLDGFFGFLQALGITERKLQWDIPIPTEAQQFAQQQLDTTRKSLIINPCSSSRLRNWRNWSAQKYAYIADYAQQQYGMQVVLTGGPAENERAMAAAIEQACQHTLVNLVGQTNLKQMLAVLAQGSVLISPDTGPAHMATAVGLPVIGLYASSNPRRTGPYLSEQWLVDKYPEALLKYNKQHVSDVRWGQRVRSAEVMDCISTDDVKHQLDALLKALPLSQQQQ